MSSPSTDRTPLALHACCGPCSLMPVRRLREAGFEPHILFCNPNIAPAAEYERRWRTLREWARGEALAVQEVEVAPEVWDAEVGAPYEAARAAGVAEDEARAKRCRACYRLRFEATARQAREAGLVELSTTLSVSPYQYTDVIAEELERAAVAFGLRERFEDFRPWYREATSLARELGLYRQNYCGCAFSAAEAAREREERKAARAQAAALRREALAPERKARERARAQRTRERKIYDEKRARQRAVLRSLRGL